MLTTAKLTLPELQQLVASRFKNMSTHYLQGIPSVALKSALHDALSNTGKLLRPQLIYATGAIFDTPLDHLDIPACAVEMLHTYSLIHDDLPCMDNADLRRGQPTTHKSHGEAMAVLAGDALSTLSMQIITDHPASLDASKRLKMIAALCRACGPYGMVAGQALDMTTLSDSNLSIDLLCDIYRLKTGALLTTCIELGWLASSDENLHHQQALLLFGQRVGLAFQIQDDILDIEVDTAALGKPQGIDQQNNKNTYPKLVGIDQAKYKVQQLYQEALESINFFGNKAQLLREVIAQLLARKK